MRSCINSLLQSENGLKANQIIGVAAGDGYDSDDQNGYDSEDDKGKGKEERKVKYPKVSKAQGRSYKPILPAPFVLTAGIGNILEGATAVANPDTPKKLFDLSNSNNNPSSPVDYIFGISSADATAIGAPGIISGGNLGIFDLTAGYGAVRALQSGTAIFSRVFPYAAIASGVAKSAIEYNLEAPQGSYRPAYTGNLMLDNLQVGLFANPYDQMEFDGIIPPTEKSSWSPSDTARLIGIAKGQTSKTSVMFSCNDNEYNVSLGNDIATSFLADYGFEKKKAGVSGNSNSKSKTDTKFKDTVTSPMGPDWDPDEEKEWTLKSRLKDKKLPITGKLRFIPDAKYNPSNQLRRGPNNGYMDKFGNEWTKGPSRTPGEPFEWDVQLSEQGKRQLGWASRKGNHVNVSLNGKITH